VLDVWSRRIVGWCIAERGSAEIAAELITHACREGNFDPTREVRQRSPPSSSLTRAVRATSIPRAWCCTPTTASRCAPVPLSQLCSGSG
jgi:hypothetical protein